MELDAINEGYGALVYDDLQYNEMARAKLLSDVTLLKA